MSDILEASRAQKLDLQLKTLGPFFRITATSLQTCAELGKAEGLVRISFQGTKILHLDSMKLRRETLSMEKSIFGLGLFIGAVAILHGYDSGCTIAQLLAINDSDLYHSKLLCVYFVCLYFHAKGLWSPEEDNKLRNYILNYGHGGWSSVPLKQGFNFQRNGKSCRLRWINYLRPGLKRGMFTKQEEDTIVTFHHMLGNKSMVGILWLWSTKFAKVGYSCFKPDL